MRCSLSNIQAVFTHLLLILFLLLPFQLQFIKLFLVLSIITLSIITKEIYISNKCFLWNITLIIFNTLCLLVAYVKGNPGPSFYIATYIIWPILFTFLSGTIEIRKVQYYLKTIKICVILIIILGIGAFLYFNITLKANGVLFNFKASIRPGFPFIAFSSPVITVFLFWFFFFFILNFIQPLKINISKILFIVFGIIFIFATSRRVLFLNFVIALLIVCLSIPFLSSAKALVKRRMTKSIIGISIFLISVLSILIANDLMDSTSMLDFFDKTSEASDEPRKLQTEALLEGWLQNPFFGAGTGIDAHISRSNIPGTYELTYLAKLFEVGLVGMVIYVLLWILLFYWTYSTLKRGVVNRNYVIATICAMIIFLIANATNPYMGAFDYMWFTYIPFVLINLTDKHKRYYE